MWGIGKFFRRPKTDPLTAMSLDYTVLEQIGRRIDRTIEVQLVDGTIIRIFDRQANTSQARAYY